MQLEVFTENSLIKLKIYTTINNDCVLETF